MHDDAELLLRYANQRDDAAFAEIVRRHLDLVYSAALRRLAGDAHGAADVAQQVFVALARQAGPVSRRPELLGWLYATTRNIAVDHVRAETRRRAREQEISIMQSLDSNQPAAEWERLRPTLDAVMDELSDADRQAVLLRFFAQRSFATIGATLHLSEDAARMRVDRALEKLRVRLSRRGVTSTSAALSLALGSHTVMAAPAGLAATVTGTALGSVGATAGPALALLHFMTSTKIITLGGGLLVALTLGSMVGESRAARAVKAALAATEHDNQAVQDRVHALQQQASETEHAVASLEAALNDEQTKTAEAQRTARAAAVRAREVMLEEAETYMTRHPHLRQAFIDHYRAEAAGRYGPLLRELRLSPEQIEQFKDLVVQGRSGRYRAQDGTVIPYHVGGDRAAAEVQLQALLGEGFRRYTEFGDAGRTVQLTMKLAADLHYTAAPLAAEQAQQMLRLLDRNRVTTEWSVRPEYDWETIMAESRAVLSDAQLVALEAYRVGDELAQAMTRKRRQQ